MSPGNKSEMPFLDHLEELRWRILWSLAALVVGVGASFWFLFINDDFIIRVLAQPIRPYLTEGRLITTHPAEAFRVILNLSLILGTILASPVIVWQIWGFLSPALYRHEKKVVIPILVLAAILFLAGAALSWFVILPLTLKVFTGIQSASLEPMIRASEYFGFAMGMSVALGAAFELPTVILLLSLLGIVTPSMLHKFRRFALVGAIVLGAFITPGQDPLTLLLMAGPLYALYELSVILSALVFRWRKRREAAGSA
ncbi:MAG TPA: twin-arginine translocase subunit TatC [Gemmatimonadaceae bacterium]